MLGAPGRGGEQDEDSKICVETERGVRLSSRLSTEGSGDLLTSSLPPVFLPVSVQNNSGINAVTSSKVAAQSCWTSESVPTWGPSLHGTFMIESTQNTELDT